MEPGPECAEPDNSPMVLTAIRRLASHRGAGCIRLPSDCGMAELVNLRTARKRAKRRQDELRADSNRLVHGAPKRQRQLAAARQTKAKRELDLHRIDKGDGR